MKNKEPFINERLRKIDAFAQTLQDYLSPLGVPGGVVGPLRAAIKGVVNAGLKLAEQRTYPVPRRTGCRPGDNFDPRLMTAEGILPGSEEESELVEAGAKVGMVFSPPFLMMKYNLSGMPAWDVETVEGVELSRIIIRKGDVFCYTIKEGIDGRRSVEIPTAPKECGSIME